MFRQTRFVLFVIFLLGAGLGTSNAAPHPLKGSETDAAFFFEASRAWSDPDYHFSQIYEGAEGMTFAAGLDVGVFFRNARVDLGHLGIMRTEEWFDVLDPQGDYTGIDQRANKTGTYFLFETYQPLVGSDQAYFSLDFGTRIGGANFKVSDDLFNALGGTTGTELGIENGMTQFSHGFNVGSSLHVLGRFSAGYSFMWNQEPKIYKFWHTLISGALQYGGLWIVNTAPDWIAPASVEKTAPYQLFALGLLIGTGAALFDYTYDHYNWPYEEWPPLRLHAHRLTLNIAVF